MGKHCLRQILPVPRRSRKEHADGNVVRDMLGRRNMYQFVQDR